MIETQPIQPEHARVNIEVQRAPKNRYPRFIKKLLRDDLSARAGIVGHWFTGVRIAGTRALRGSILWPGSSIIRTDRVETFHQSK